MTAITQADVSAAADEISTAGQQPTVAMIRKHLGSGSYTTITAMLRTWRDQSDTSAPPTLEMPIDVNDAIHRAGQLIWNAAQTAFQIDLKAIRTETAKATAAAHAELHETLLQMDNLQTAYDSLTESHKQICDQLRAEQETNQKLLQTLAANAATITSQTDRLTEQAALIEKLISAKTQAQPPDTAKPKLKPTTTTSRTTATKQATPEHD